MKKIKKFFKSSFKDIDAGFFEYLFAITAIISVMPSVICYIIIVKLIVLPAGHLVKKVWK